MGRRYTAYVLRRWQQDDGREWVELQQIATGERRRFTSLNDTYVWLQSQNDGQAPAALSVKDNGPRSEDSG